MKRFKWDRERQPKDDVRPASNAFVIKDSERGSRESIMKHRAKISSARRNVPVTLAGKYGVDADEP